MVRKVQGGTIYLTFEWHEGWGAVTWKKIPRPLFGELKERRIHRAEKNIMYTCCKKSLSARKVEKSLCLYQSARPSQKPNGPPLELSNPYHLLTGFEVM